MAAEVRPDLGVLFVHGIGSQRSGSTLRGFGGPLVESVGRWLGDDSVTRHPLTAAPGEPQHERVTIVDGDRTLEVLAAESWWADTVQPPSYGELLGWLVTAVPFVVTRGFDTGLRQTNRGIDKQLATPDRGLPRPASWLGALLLIPLTVLRVVQNVLVVALSTFLLVALFLLGLFGVLGGDRERMRGLRAFVVSYIGDSYALLLDPRDITARVQRDLAWLEARTRAAPVVVVAHSQGAEVVRRVLRPRTAPVAALVTFGSGIEKLYAVDLLRRSLGRSFFAFVLRGVSVAAVVVAVAGAIEGWSWPPVAGLLVAAFASLTAARALLRRIVGKRYDSSHLEVGPDQVRRWTDLYASSDPVSEGSLPVEALGSSTRIVNRRLIVTDHTSYWQNVEAFRAAVALEIARAARWWDAMQLPQRVIVASARRARRVWVLVAARWIAILGALAVWIAIGGGVPAAIGFALAAGALIVVAEILWGLWSDRRTNAEFPRPR